MLELEIIGKSRSGLELAFIILHTTFIHMILCYSFVRHFDVHVHLCNKYLVPSWVFWSEDE